MISLGNDIVDLKESDSDLGSYNKKFISRVLCGQEQKIFPGDLFSQQSKSDKQYKKWQTLFWSYWALKEAAYKAVKRIMPEAYFSPKEFVVSEDLEAITYRDIVLHSGVEKTNDFIHAIAHISNSQGPTPGADEYHCKIDNIQDEDNIEKRKSLLVRQKLQKDLAKRYSTEPESIVVKTLNSLPLLCIAGKHYLLSFSHHGRYIASLASLNRSVYNI